MRTIFDQTIDGFTFTGFAEIEPAQSATDIDPSFPAIITVYELHVDGSTKDFIDIIDPAIVQSIERTIALDY